MQNTLHNLVIFQKNVANHKYIAYKTALVIFLFLRLVTERFHLNFTSLASTYYFIYSQSNDWGKIPIWISADQVHRI